MKRIVGWVMFFAMLPVIVLGMVGHLVADSFIYGWRFMKQTLEDWDD